MKVKTKVILSHGEHEVFIIKNIIDFKLTFSRKTYRIMVNEHTDFAL